MLKLGGYTDVLRIGAGTPGRGSSLCRGAASWNLFVRLRDARGLAGPEQRSRGLGSLQWQDWNPGWILIRQGFVFQAKRFQLDPEGSRELLKVSDGEVV